MSRTAEFSFYHSMSLKSFNSLRNTKNVEQNILSKFQLKHPKINTKT